MSHAFVSPVNSAEKGLVTLHRYAMDRPIRCPAQLCSALQEAVST